MAAEPYFYTWGTEKEDKQRVSALNKTYQKIADSQTSSHYHTKGSDIFKNIYPSTSLRDGFDRRDYEWFREDERIPEGHKEIKKKCRRVYRKVGLIRNIVDLMADFTVQGMRIVHAVPICQRFFNSWADKVNMVDRSERMANNLIKQGCFALNRTSAKLTEQDVEDFKKGLAYGEKVQKNSLNIPFKYVFLNPATLDVIGGDLALLSGNIKYGVEIPPTTAAKIKNPKSDSDKKLVASLPPYIVNGVRNGERIIPLDEDKTVVGHYKKDDYELWADSMLYSVLDDIIMLNKLKLADMSALDGVISHVRLWKLGSLEHKIAPNPAVMGKLSDILINNVAGGCMDLIWGPELSLQETSGDQAKFLGNEKYQAVLNSIYAGLGIPQTLTGGTAVGTTNNYISLKTLLERLNYIRGIIVNFWMNELRRVQIAMGFAQPAFIEFDKTTLTDEVAEKNLILSMVDRDIISITTAQERLGENPEIERIRQKKESKKREKGQIPDKASPFHNANHQKDIEKIGLQSGLVSPESVGLDTTNAPKTNIFSAEPTNKKPKGEPGQGRPSGKKDKTKRKTKRFVPRSVATITENFIKARRSQAKIAAFFDEKFVKLCKKDNMRQLSTDEAKQLEDLKFASLCSFDLNDEITEASIEASLEKDLCIPNSVEQLCKVTISKQENKTGKPITLDEIRQIQAMCYALYKGDLDG